MPRSYLLTLEGDRIVLRAFDGPVLVVGLSSREVFCVDRAITEVEAMVKHISEELYEAASAVTVEMDKEATFVKDMLGPGGRG